MNRKCLHYAYICACIVNSTECPVLEHPCNGFLVDPPINPKPGDAATYDCMEGFVLDGENARACQDDYTWDGISPCCVKRTCRGMNVFIVMIRVS